MALTRAHHVTFVVSDPDAARHVLVNGFGLALDQRRSPWPAGRPGDFDAVTSFEFPLAELYIEVSRPSDPDSPAGRFVAERRGVGGLHHVTLASTDLTGDVARLRSQGLRVLAGRDERSPVFLDPETTLGLLFRIAPPDEYYPHPTYRGAGLATGVAHVGIAARSYEEVRHLLTDGLGIPADPRGAGRAGGDGEAGPADDDVSTYAFPLGGVILEVSVPNDDVSGTARFLAQRGRLGASFHHLCPHAPDVRAFMERSVAAGLQPIGELPPVTSGQMAVGWLHPRNPLGTLIEVWDLPPAEARTLASSERSGSTSMITMASTPSSTAVQT